MFWKCRDGRVVKVTDMDDRHLSNTIRMLEREAGDEDPHDIWIQYEWLVAERQARVLANRWSLSQNDLLNAHYQEVLKIVREKAGQKSKPSEKTVPRSKPRPLRKFMFDNDTENS